ncbi:hypothetical protein [Hymenobacter psychrophilus]|uniref:hypothetical protein n=1 Tax=Hymenobacter psychrophilus TaxID=651662 RepID=UPI0011148535|nr:hypothetical protein [Hymenobacter psychrophilus]
MFIQLLLSSDIKTLEDWVLVIIWWIPQLIWVGIATLVLVGVMLGLRRFWIRWVIMWVPYAMVGWAIDTAVGMERNHYEFDNLLSLLDHDSNFRIQWAAILLAVPFLIVLHAILFRKQAQRKARGV